MNEKKEETSLGEIIGMTGIFSFGTAAILVSIMLAKWIALQIGVDVPELTWLAKYAQKEIAGILVVVGALLIWLCDTRAIRWLDESPDWSANDDSELRERVERDIGM